MFSSKLLKFYVDNNLSALRKCFGFQGNVSTFAQLSRKLRSFCKFITALCHCFVNRLCALVEAVTQNTLYVLSQCKLFTGLNCLFSWFTICYPRFANYLPPLLFLYVFYIVLQHYSCFDAQLHSYFFVCSA